MRCPWRAFGVEMQPLCGSRAVVPSVSWASCSNITLKLARHAALWLDPDPLHQTLFREEAGSSLCVLIIRQV